MTQFLLLVGLTSPMRSAEGVASKWPHIRSDYDGGSFPGLLFL